MQTGVTDDRAAPIGENPGAEIVSISGFGGLSAQADTLVELRNLPLPQDDLDLFETGPHRGRAVLYTRIDRSELDKALRVIDMFEPIDLDRTSEQGSTATASAPFRREHWPQVSPA